MPHRERNERLERLHREAGWTLRQFAMAVNRLGTERGTPLAYSAPSPHQWISGCMPREDVQPLVVEALARRLGRPISYAEVGFPTPDVTVNSAGIVEGLIDLGRLDMNPERRNFIGVTLYSATLPFPAWSDVAGRLDAMRAGRVTRAGAADVEAVTEATRQFSALDSARGGRVPRPSAAAFLVNVVAPYLRAEAPDQVRRAMASAASELCYLTGNMAVDEGLHGLAQRYYLKALELAGAADDRLFYCLALDGMSVQAIQLRHTAASLRLAEATAEALPAGAGSVGAHVAARRAHAAAATGDGRTAVAALDAAEQAMHRADADEDPVTVERFRPATLAYYEARVRYDMGDVRGCLGPMQERVAALTGPRLRRRVLMKARLAEWQCKLGHLEAACHTWHEVLDEYPGVRSARCEAQIRTMYARIRPYLKNRAARNLYERARTLPATAALA